jgi:diguanylate cyclase (GGDEF)-like protein/PAS domain S-box-containing protein
VTKLQGVLLSLRYDDAYGHFSGVISAMVPITSFERLLAGLDVGPHGIVSLRDADTALFARYPPSTSPSAQIGGKAYSEALATAIASGLPAVTFHTKATGDLIERMDAYRRLSAVPFHLVVGMGTDDYLAPWRRDVAKAMLVASIFLLVSMGLAWLLWRSLKETERAAEHSRLLLCNASDGIAILDIKGNITEVSDSFCRMLGYTRAEMIGMHVSAWDARFSSAELAMIVAPPTGGNEPLTFETLHRGKDGRLIDVEVSRTVFDLGDVPTVYTSVRDISARKQAEAAQRTSELRYRTAFQTSHDAISITHLRDGTYLDVNQAFLDKSGYSRDEVIGRTSQDLNMWVNPEDRRVLQDALHQTGKSQGAEIQFRRKDGGVLWTTTSASVMEIDGSPCVLSVTRDMTDIKAAADEIRTLAFYDPLTGLPNRRLLIDRLHQALAVGVHSRRKRALLFVDLDNFKMLNDSRDHTTGDLLLCEVAQRITTCVRETDTVARLGGDEFVVLIDDLSENPAEAASQAEIVGEKILAVVSQPYRLAGRECRSTASIGITIFGNQGESSDTLLTQADIAMYQAKAAGRNALRIFSPDLQAAVNVRAGMEEDLRLGMINGQFLLHYQPQIDASGVIGAEALLRWQHPERGMVSPCEFIPLAEETGLILPLGSWVLETACRQIAAWAEREETAHITLAVNVSARQFRQPNFTEVVMEALDRTGANPQNLKLELTESMLVDNVDDVIVKMTTLRSRGLKFALDDFGTGYSSLSYLKRLPLDQLKIDQSFVRDLFTDANDGAIAQTIVALGQAMGLSVIAEGVETEEQRDFLTRLGCHAFQGFLFSRPLPLEQFLQMVRGLTAPLSHMPA